jgi:hypothetical protein
LFVDGGAVAWLADVAAAVVGCGCGGCSDRAGAMSYDPRFELGMFRDWRQAGKVVAGWVGFGLLVWAAIYELVKW